jgi:hypothetical protein
MWFVDIIQTLLYALMNSDTIENEITFIKSKQLNQHLFQDLTYESYLFNPIQALMDNNEQNEQNILNECFDMQIFQQLVENDEHHIKDMSVITIIKLVFINQLANQQQIIAIHH